MTLNFLSLLSSGYIPHGHCYLWQTPLVGLHTVSNFFIAIAYFSIPVTLIYFVRKSTQPFSYDIVLLFGLFITLCGVGHIFDIVTLWIPIYWTSGIVRALTALVSVYTAMELIFLLPKFLALRNPQELEDINQQLKNTVDQQESIQAELTTSQQLFQGAFEDAPIGMALVSLDGTFLKVNKELTKIVGYTKQELLATDFQTITHPDDLEIDLSCLNELISGTRRTYQLEKRYFHKQGHTVTIHLSVALLAGSHQHPAHFIAHIRDITEQKKTRLSLEAAIKEAAEGKAKSDFLSMMSHEIRTPMNAMLGMTELLSETALDTQQQDYVEVVRTSGNTLLTVINDILDFSKIDSNNLTLEICHFDLYDCVEGVVSLFSNQAEQKGLELTVLIDSKDRPHLFKGDPIRLRQILTNLVSNSIKFTENGEVSIQVKILSADSPAAGLSKNEYQVQFAIKDTGIGITQDKLQKLFQPFSQADTSITRKYGGTGLGLVISKQLIEMMNGKIWVESTVGQGSAFHFFIRLTACEPSAQSDDSELSQKRLLIVDSNQTSRQHLMLQAKSWQINATAASSAETALAELLNHDPFDLVAINEPLPDIDASTLVQQIRALPQYQTVPVIWFKPQQNSLSQYSYQTDSNIKLLRKPIRRSQFYNALVQYLLGKNLVTYQNPDTNLSTRSESDLDASLRILLVEDIPLNQKVALAMLDTYGYGADVANNGREAIDAIRQKPYELVLMDIQMPEIDGFEATRRIRLEHNILQPYIVAMTAHAMHHDRLKCLTAGMNNYISKPVRRRDLGSVLQQYSAGLDGYSTPDEPVRSVDSINALPAEVAEMLLELSDLSSLDTQYLESISSERSVLNEVCKIFLSDAPERISAVKTALDKKDSTALEETAHALKSLSSCVGANRLFQLCKSIEMLGKIDCIQPSLSLINQVRDEYQKVLTSLQNYQATL